MKDETKTKIAKVIGYTRYFAKWIPPILQLVCIIALIPLLTSFAPYVEGTEELENPMTASQLTAMFGMLAICYGVLIIGRFGRH